MPRHINLLDPSKKIRSPYTTVLQMAVPVALVLLVMGSWAATVRFQLGATKQKLQQVEAQKQPINEQLTQLQAGLGIEQVNANLRERLERAQAQLKARTDIQTALLRGDLGSTQGFSEFMRAFARQTVPGLWLTGLKLDNGGRDITLVGRTLSADAVATLVRQLRAEPALRGRAIATLRVAPLPPPEKTEQRADDRAGDKRSERKEEIVAAQTLPAATLPRVYEFEISSVAPEVYAKAAEASPAGGVAGVGTAIGTMLPKAFQ